MTARDGRDVLGIHSEKERLCNVLFEGDLDDFEMHILNTGIASSIFSLQNEV
jgi:hypothetical protein